MKFLKIPLLIIILTIFSASLSSAAFREPTSPTDSVPAPVNSLTPGQTKIGSLNLPSLSVLGDLTTGYVGIGGDANNPNSIPQEKLDIQGSLNIHNQILIDNIAPSNGQILHFTYDNPNGLPRLRWGGNYAFINLISDVKNPGCILDGICDPEETCSNCPGDCLPATGESCVPATGERMGPDLTCDLDKMCEAANGENYNNCQDCRGCENPGLGCNNNGICEDKLATNQNEGWQSCSTDCTCPFRKYKPIPPSSNPFCGDGIKQYPEQCDPPSFGGKPAFIPQGLCFSIKWCDEFCNEARYDAPDWSKPEDTVPPNFPRGSTTPGPGDGGGGACKNNNKGTGAPQCGGSCDDGETCQDNNGGSGGGSCECLPPVLCGDTYPQCNGSCPTGESCYESKRNGDCRCGVFTPKGSDSVDDLLASNTTSSSTTLTFSAPGGSNEVSAYIFKESLSPINQSNFDSATSIPNSMIPQDPGSSESLTVTGLSPNTVYYFAQESVDVAGNISLISNTPVIAETLPPPPDTTPPAPITTLKVTNLGTSVTMTWLATGDDGNIGTSDHLEIRYNDVKMTPGTFNVGILVPTPPPIIVANGGSQSRTVNGLINGQTLFFLIKVFDEAGNFTFSNQESIEIGSNGGSNPAFNGSNYKNPFASLFDAFGVKLVEKVQAQSGSACGDVWKPLACRDPLIEFNLLCVNDLIKPFWIRSCYKEMP
ncbi:MAG: hypothetical protein EXS49_01205 [Candidatus Pacebacteria bacterium]|nr:hypothetical protein [Candidatus Paceibacterota bacterium]